MIILTILFVLWDCLSVVHGAASDCSFTASDGFSLDLSSLYDDVLWKVDSKWNYTYSPCQDGINCETASVMVNQYNTETETCTSFLALWNSTVKPKKSGNAYTLTYRNGQSSSSCGDNGNRAFVAKFECGTSSWSVTDITEGDGCVYTMTIKTNLACSGSASTGISVGTIICICLAVLIFLYCVIGYGINAKRNPENGLTNVRANTPHLTFWATLPKWTWAGCCVTKEFIVKSVNKARGRDPTEYETVDD